MINDVIKGYLDCSYYRKIIGSHREWLNRFDGAYLNKWDELFTKNNPEAALCEAATRQMLEEQDVEVEPFDLECDRQSPDFMCKKEGFLFYVEATCLTKEVVDQKTGLEDIPEEGKTTWFGLLTRTIFQEACNKTPQCSNLHAPCLLCIGTLHFSACQLCLTEMGAEQILTSDPLITVPLDKETGDVVGEIYESTDLKWSAFIKPSKTSNGIEIARNPISGIILFPFGARPVEIFGALHPNPNYTFERKYLPAIKFCRLKGGWCEGSFAVEWI